MKYDIFISYRRDGGYETAKHIYDLLRRDHYNVSFDLDTLRNGNFNTQLLDRIMESNDFIIILDKNAFDRTMDPNFERSKDWMRIELAKAIEEDKNIIPVFLEGFENFPENLPEDIAAIKYKNAPEYSRGYFDAFYERLKKFLISNPSVSYEERNVTTPMALVRFQPDMDCRVVKYGEVLGEVKAGEYFPIKLKKGKHHIDFISLKDEETRETVEHVVTDTEAEDVVKVEIPESLGKKFINGMAAVGSGIASGVETVGKGVGTGVENVGKGVAFGVEAVANGFLSGMKAIVNPLGFGKDEEEESEVDESKE